MFRKILAYIMMFFIQYYSFSQITPATQVKYWHYRQKLISDFEVIGYKNPYNYTPNIDSDYTKNQYGGCGLSIPAGWRYDQSKIKYPNHYNWGDGTTYLGWYIGVLATELRLLYDSYGPLHPQFWQSTQQELYYALKAYERLDATASVVAFPWTNTPGVNGTFLRDDVDTNLFKNSPTLRAKANTWDSALKGSYYDGFYDFFNNTNYYYPMQLPVPYFIVANAASWMSPDQCAHLFMGFALVERCLSNCFPYTNPCGSGPNLSPIQVYNDTNLIMLVHRSAIR